MNVRTLLCFLMVLCLSACSQLVSHHSGNHTVSSSLVDFLYPKDAPRPALTPAVPLLKLPVRVGIAFVPPQAWRQEGVSVAEQMKLLEQVKAAFVQYDYIGHIELIPSTYLKGANGFDTLDQVGRMFDVDIMALVSYDQLQQSLERKSALLYWTIVGLYTVPGNQNSVQTFVDTAVFDLATHKMLFRAPGVSQLKESSTAIGVDVTINNQSRKGYQLAVNDMITNLDAELGRFKTRVKEEHVAKVENRAGYSGGALGILALLLLPLLRWRRARG
ncbi:rhombotarget lipoprotein [Shewanella avicenniae]|uniref:Rhombotarget lipoprotein n=1 Tax=Shewanella avicenniae TaxID=2814294 RepID=A0ABX7QQC1_9GAMM|nr:rhombotarget lipoprotein [Shewanella avicenniae]QSX33175.1 rhombotarget lipoprotein [Shewanella avicenniae]